MEHTHMRQPLATMLVRSKCCASSPLAGDDTAYKYAEITCRLKGYVTFKRP